MIVMACSFDHAKRQVEEEAGAPLVWITEADVLRDPEIKPVFMLRDTEDDEVWYAVFA